MEVYCQLTMMIVVLYHQLTQQYGLKMGMILIYLKNLISVDGGSINFLNTPYFHKQLYDDFKKLVHQENMLDHRICYLIHYLL